MAVIFPGLERAAAYAVREQVRDLADDLAAQARADLAGHRRTGASRIEVTQGAVDCYVNLVDAAAESIEFGTARMRGLHVLGVLT